MKKKTVLYQLVTCPALLQKRRKYLGPYYNDDLEKLSIASSGAPSGFETKALSGRLCVHPIVLDVQPLQRLLPRTYVCTFKFCNLFSLPQNLLLMGGFKQSLLLLRPVTIWCKAQNPSWKSWIGLKDKLLQKNFRHSPTFFQSILDQWGIQLPCQTHLGFGGYKAY